MWRARQLMIAQGKAMFLIGMAGDSQWPPVASKSTTVASTAATTGAKNEALIARKVAAAGTSVHVIRSCAIREGSDTQRCISRAMNAASKTAARRDSWLWVVKAAIVPAATCISAGPLVGCRTAAAASRSVAKTC